MFCIIGIFLYNTVDTLSYKTVSANPNMIEKKWVVVDATDQIVGRLASKVAIMLRGKNKTYYTPNMDCGDYVIIINAEKVRFTEAVVREAIRKMLPKTRLGAKMYRNLHVYAGPEHSHQAQSPVTININEQK